MSMRIFRKAFGLLIVDIVIIIGIFVLQFRTDSNIIEKIGNLQFTFAQTEDQNNVVSFTNKINISYNGINFYCDDQHPAICMDGNSNTVPVNFIGYDKVDDLSYKLHFDNNISVVFELASTEPNASLAIIGELPSKVKNFAIPYNYSSNMKIQKNDENKVILEGRKATWEVSAHSLSSGYFSISSRDFVATYAIYDETQKFTFDSITELAIADSGIFKQNVDAFKKNLIASFKANNAEANLTEQIVVSYIAAQSEYGNYAAAIEEIPQTIKKSKQRTYLSAPYLNTLEEMNANLDKTIKEQERKITEASNSNNLDIFTVHNIADFMCIHSNPDIVKKLLQSTGYVDISNLTIAQATGILQTFVDLSSSNTEYAKCLMPALENCVEKITSACSYDGNVLTVSENDTFLSVLQAIETGISLLRYGEATNNITLQKAGYVLVNSYLTESASFDLRTLSNLYPIIAYNNWYYPHFQKIIDIEGHLIWTWTCATSITANTSDPNALTLTIDFPENKTHYVIIKGIPAFKKIYIYNMAFRTDPRFETYNSSGYVYKQNTQTLLLKSRHKSKLETVRFEYNGKINYNNEKPQQEVKPENPNAVPVTVIPTEKPAEKPADKPAEKPAEEKPADTPAEKPAEELKENTTVPEVPVEDNNQETTVEENNTEETAQTETVEETQPEEQQPVHEETPSEKRKREREEKRKKKNN